MADGRETIWASASEAEELSALYDSAPIGMCVLDRDLRYIRINARLAEINGLPAEAHIGRTVREIVPDLAEQAEATMRRVLDGESVYGIEFSGTTPARPGVLRTWRENWVPLRNGAGAISGISISAEEITSELATEAEFQAMERRTSFGLEAARMVAWTFDLRTGQGRRSANSEELFGLKSEGTSDFYDLVHPDDIDRLKEVQAAALAGAADYDTEFRLNHPDGRIRWVAVRGRLQRSESGEPISLAGVLMDITARKEAELAAERSAADFEALAENVSQLAWMAEPDGQVTWYNRRWYDFTGTDPGVPAEQRPSVVHPDELERVREKWFRLFGLGEPWEDTFRLRRHDGVYRWFLSRAEPIRDAAGRITRWFGTNTDVTDQIETAEALARSEARFRTIAEALPGMLFVANAVDGNVDVNRGYCEFTGLTKAELLGDGWIETLHPDDRERAEEIWRRALRSETLYTAEYRFRRHDGVWRWHIVRGLPVRSETGVVTQWVGACIDIQDRKVAEEELQHRVDEAVVEREQALLQLHEAQKLETIGQMTGGVAHDFNNLLTPIVGSLDLLRRKIDDERLGRLIDGALASAERARTLIQRLLAFARRQTLQPRPVDTHSLVNGMRDLIQRSLGPRIEFVTEIDDRLPPALIDANQLELALLNLSINARDAMPIGGRLIWRISLAKVNDGEAGLSPGRYLRLAVTDTGVGMEPATLARAVEPFFSTKAAGQGTGLGLSMVHGLAAQSGGAFRLESSPGEGTTAILWLPVAAEAAASPARELETRSASRRALVMLVDDEEQVRFITSESLGELGYDVIEAASAEEALELVAGGATPDLLVTDHLMPGMTGAQLALELRRNRPKLPVLMITGYAQLRPEEAGDFDVLVKPYRHAELALRIADLLAEEPVLQRSLS